jgi:MFS family permease
MGKYIKNPDLFELLLSLGLLGIGGFIINVGLGLHMQNLFGTSGEQYGYYLALSGLIAAFNLGFLIRKFWMKYFSHRFLIIMNHIVFIAGYMMMAQAQDKTVFLILFYSIMMLGNMYMTIYNIEIMTAAPKDKIGEVSGMLGGMQSLFMFLGPLIG